MAIGDGTRRDIIVVVVIVLIIAVAFVYFFRGSTLPSWRPINRLPATANVVTQHGDNLRSGAQLLEKVLTTSTVRTNNFGKLATRRVFGQIYAQPLYVQNVDVRGAGRRNVVYVATMRNTIYAFDADDTSPNAGPLWMLQLRHPFDLDYDSKFRGCTDIFGRVEGRVVGITSTPVVDVASNTMYLVAKIGLGQAEAQFMLAAVDIRSGALIKSTLVEGEVLGSGNGSVRLSLNHHRDHHTVIRFQPKFQHQRASLLLSNGILYIAFGSHCDKGPYHGWLFAYDVPTLAPRAWFNTTPMCCDICMDEDGNLEPYQGERGSIWQAGQGPAADAAGNVYFITGDGAFNGFTNFGDSVLKLKPPRLHSFAVTSYFTPSNYGYLDCEDEDFGSSGVLLVPGTNALLGGGKPGTLYLLDRTDLGGIERYETHVLGQIAFGGHIHGSPVFWNSPAGPRVYVWSENEQLKSFGLRIRHRISPITLTLGTQTHFDGAPPKMSNVRLTKHDILPDGKVGDAMPGGFLTISANGSTPGTGIVWANYPKTNANERIAEGILYAFDAETLAKIWSSEDFRLDVDNHLGIFAKFVAPTVANGKVYMAAWSEDDPDHMSGRLHIYGILPCLNPSECEQIP
jgi:outer membrane protein assembly factor BamB